jgi:hypothetical protein
MVLAIVTARRGRGRRLPRPVRKDDQILELARKAA